MDYVQKLIIILIYYRHKLLDLASYLRTEADSSHRNVLNKNRAMGIVQKASNCIKLLT
jgi:hypothetical protein